MNNSEIDHLIKKYIQNLLLKDLRFGLHCQYQSATGLVDII